MKTINTLALASMLTFLCLLTASAADHYSITVTNPMKVARVAPEIVEIDLTKVQHDEGCNGLIVINEAGESLQTQITYDNKLLFTCPALAAKEIAKFTIINTNACALPDGLDISIDTEEHEKPAIVRGRLYPERQDDISFENDRIGYRIYGPVTEKIGEKLTGYDLWCKRTSRLVLDDWYSKQCDGEMWARYNKLKKSGKGAEADDLYNDGYCYHVDHGEGMDCYKVGQTLGAGAPDIPGDICFKSAEILDNGPLRFTCRFFYTNDIRVMTLDAHSNMVRTTVGYYADNEHADLLKAGLAIHLNNPEAYTLNNKEGYIAYTDLGDPDIYAPKYRQKQDPDKGEIFLACLMPDAKKTAYEAYEKPRSGASGSAVLYLPLVEECNNKAFGDMCTANATYYFGSAWSRYADDGITTRQQWEDYLKVFAQQVKKPLKVKISNN